MSIGYAVARRTDDRKSQPGRYGRSVPPLNVSVWTVDLYQPDAIVDALRAHLDDDEVRAAAYAPRRRRS